MFLAWDPDLLCSGSEDLSQRIQKLYTMLDVDENGSLSFQEVKEGLRLLNVNILLFCVSVCLCVGVFVSVSNHIDGFRYLKYSCSQASPPIYFSREDWDNITENKTLLNQKHEISSIQFEKMYFINVPMRQNGLS